MSGLTPEAARAAAEWLDNNVGYDGSARELRAEADRMETAAKTPGQVLAEHQGLSWLYVPHSFRVTHENRAAAVIAHHVGPGRVVVERSDVKSALTCLMYESPNEETRQARNRLRKALS